jgi:hypothetical protein
VDEVTGWNSCHIYGWGLADWYVLTGDMEAKKAVTDLAEIGWYHWKDATQGYWERRFSRPLKVACAVYGLDPADPVWKQRFDKYVSLMKNVPNWDPRGFLGEEGDQELNADRLFSESATKPYVRKDFYDLTNPAQPLVVHETGGSCISNDLYTVNKNGNSLQVWRPTFMQFWMLTYFAQAVEKMYELTGDEDFRDYVIGLADFYTRYGVVSPCQVGAYACYLDFPTPDSVRYDVLCSSYWRVHDVNCRQNRGVTSTAVYDSIAGHADSAYHSGYENRHDVTAPAYAYELTGDPRFLNAAWQMWQNGSRRPYASARFLCDTNKVCWFLNAGSYNQVWSPLVAPLFHDMLNLKSPLPDRIADLKVWKTGKPNEWGLAWTTPANAGSGGETQIKWDTKPIKDYADFKYSKDVQVLYAAPNSGLPKFTASTWHMANNVQGEPAAVGGSTQSFILTVNQPTVYFAVRVRTPDGSLGPLSNVVKGDPSTAVEERAAASMGAPALSASPNPSNLSTCLIFRIPGLKGAQSEIALCVYSVNGQRVRTLLHGRQASGVRTVRWNGRNDLGREVPSGVYLIKLRMAGKELCRKFTLMK